MKALNSIIQFLVLEPLSWLWEFLYKQRRSFYQYGILKRAYFKVPIISVGNLTFGGTGKTPIIIWLIDYFEKQGKVPMVLSRGYKGDLEGSAGMIKGGQRFRSNPKHFGDEPLLISKKMKSGAVVVGKKRSENLLNYFSKVQPDIVLLDDGFQHLKLFRNFNIVLFDALLPLDRYRTAPMGYLREGFTALKDADAIMISRADQVSEEKIQLLINTIEPYFSKKIPISKLKYTPVGLLDCFDEYKSSLEELKGKKVIALTAIASPESFYRLLEEHEVELVDKVEFPDHHFFTREDLNEVLLKSFQMGALIITSEKDMVKIKRVTQDRNIYYLSIKVDFIGGEEELLNALAPNASF